MLSATSSSLLAQPLRLNRRSRRPRSGSVATTALFGGPSKAEFENLKMKCQRLDKELEGAPADAVKYGAYALNDFEREKAEHTKTKDELKMISERLKQSDKELFKLERQLEEKQKALDSYQTSAQRQIKALEVVIKENGIKLG